MEENKYLVGKSDPDKNEFDVILFAKRDIKEMSVPSNIKIISPCVFQKCKYLTKFRIEPNSNLKIIGINAFRKSNIKGISIPSKVTNIGKFAFYLCKNLGIIEIPDDSKLESFPLEGLKESYGLIIMIPKPLRKFAKQRLGFY